MSSLHHLPDAVWSLWSGGIEERAARARNLQEDETPPVDNLILRAYAPHAQTVVEAGITPNHLSLMGAAFALLSLLALAARWYFTFGLLFSVSYLFDVVDGWTARTFALFSPHGEALDHWKDVGVAIALVLVLVLVIRPPLTFLVALGVAYAVAAVSEGCVQRVIEERKAAAGLPSDNALTPMAALCPPHADLRVARWTATPTFLAVMGVGTMAWGAARYWVGRRPQRLA